MHIFNISSAAQACNTSRTTILRAIKNGKLAAEKDEATNQWNIRLDDLLAAGFNPGQSKPDAQETYTPVQTPAQEDVRYTVVEYERDMYKVKLAAAERIISDKEKVIEDLRASLHLSLRALTPAPTPTPTQAEIPKKRWWQRAKPQ